MSRAFGRFLVVFAAAFILTGCGADRPVAQPAVRVVIVAVDDQLLNEERWPVNRARHAVLLDRLAAAGARVVVFEPILAASDDVDHSGDTALAEAIRRHGRVVLGAALLAPVGDRSPDAMPERFALRYSRKPGHRVRDTDRLLLPDTRFLAAAYAVGFVNLFEDNDRLYRRATSLLTCGGQAVPSLGLAAALAESGLAPDSIAAHPGEAGTLSSGVAATDLAGDRPDVNPLGDHQVEWVGYSDVIEGRVPDSTLNGAVVFVTLWATGMQDLVRWSGDARMPRARIHASEMLSFLGARK